jgi:deoxycytidine triphosphate deaminase
VSMARHEEYLWRDPFDLLSSGPVLLSDQIHFLADEVGLIEPFDPKYLRPASYDLRVGNSYYVDDGPIELNEESNEIEIPSNGLVYIKTKEKFNIPYYLVARYSLRVQQVYRGLLIDNGLHVDPGYCGYIWIPVHNFTMEPRRLSQGDEFISVEFNRTSRLPGVVSTIGSQDELVSRGIRDELTGSNGRAVKVFYKDLERYKRRHEDFTPRLFWNKFPGEKHKSGTLATDQRMDKLEQGVSASVERRVDSLRNFSLVAFAGLVIAILGILLPILYGEFGKNRNAVMQHAAEIKDLRERLQEQKNRLDGITANQAVPRPAPAVAPPAQQNGAIAPT